MSEDGKVRIDELPVPETPDRSYEFPVMFGGFGYRLSIAAMLSLLDRGDLEGELFGSDVTFNPGDAGLLSAETVQAAIDELAAAYVSTRPQTFGAAAASRARLNIGADYAPGTVNIASLSSGVLEIPAEGEHFVLTWPGNADFTISGFGDLRPAGKTFSIIVPRTAADTGGAAYARGNKVSFVHTTSGAGLDLTMNKRMFGGSAVLTYDAYPNATDSAGNTAALYEKLTFVPLGGGRHRLVKLPEPATGFTSGNSVWTRAANGEQKVWGMVAVTPVANTPTTVTFNYPLAFTEALPDLAAPSGRRTASAIALVTAAPYQRTSVLPNNANPLTSHDVIALRTNTTETGILTSSEGYWK